MKMDQQDNQNNKTEDSSSVNHDNTQFEVKEANLLKTNTPNIVNNQNELGWGESEQQLLPQKSRTINLDKSQNNTVNTVDNLLDEEIRNLGLEEKRSSKVLLEQVQENIKEDAEPNLDELEQQILDENLKQ